jgi:hypothetical protein
MSTLALPQARIPLGYAMVGGQRVPVEIDIEWMRALTVLVQRAGGTSGLSTTDVDAGGFAAMQPATHDAYFSDINQSGGQIGDTASEVLQGFGFDSIAPDVIQADNTQPTQFWSL